MKTKQKVTISDRREDINLRLEAITYGLFMLQLAAHRPDVEGEPLEYAIEGVKNQVDEVKGMLDSLR